MFYFQLLASWRVVTLRVLQNKQYLMGESNCFLPLNLKYFAKYFDVKQKLPSEHTSKTRNYIQVLRSIHWESLIPFLFVFSIYVPTRYLLVHIQFDFNYGYCPFWFLYNWRLCESPHWIGLLITLFKPSLSLASHPDVWALTYNGFKLLTQSNLNLFCFRLEESVCFGLIHLSLNFQVLN